MPTARLGCDILEQRIVLAALAAADFVFSAGTITGYTGTAAEILIPGSIEGVAVKEIADSAFANHQELKVVEIPNSVTKIGNHAFSGLTNLTKVQFGTGVQFIGDSAFRDTSLLKEVTFPKSLISIGDNAFRHSGLQGVTFGKKVELIGDHAFAENTAMMKLVIPGNVKHISAGAFQGNVSLQVLHIGKGVTSIGDSAFAGIKALRAVSIPGTVKTIGAEAFAGDTAIQYVGLGRGIQSIGGSAFAGNTALQAVVIPGSVKSIGEGAFRGDRALARAVIRSGVETIGAHAFQDNTAMTGVLIPTSVKVIGDSAYEGNVAMAGVVIGNGVHTIGNRAFYGCTALTSVVLGKGVTFMGIDMIDGGANETYLPRTFYLQSPLSSDVLKSSGVSESPPEVQNLYCSTSPIEGVPFVRLSTAMMAKKTSILTAQQARADSRRAALAEHVRQVAVSDGYTPPPVIDIQVSYSVSLGSTTQTSSVSASTAQLGNNASWSFEMPSGDTWNNTISNYTGPSIAQNEASGLLVQTGANFGPIASGSATTPTGTYSWNFTNATTGALYSISFTVT